MPAYDAVVFDLLTALLDSWTLWNSIARNASDGQRWRAEYLRISYSAGSYRSYTNLVADAAAAAGLPRTLANELDLRYNEIAPWPDANETLRTLKSSGLKLAIVTNCSERLGRLAARQLKIDFDAIVTAERAGYYKPDPRPYSLALQELRLPPERVLFVAGSGYDMFGTAKVGLATYWHDRNGMNPPPGAPEPRYHERTLTRLVHLTA